MMRTTTNASHGLYRKTTLKNGLRVITEKVPSVRSVSMGVWINVGSRYEDDSEGGMSHLIEHMLFKGTKTRSAKDIADSLESIGGNLNAFTSREQTCYTARFPAAYIDRAMDVLADMTSRSTLTPTNLKREKQVILEEIKETEENPSDHIYDLFNIAFWGKHQLGRPILGTEKSVSGMPRNSIFNYLSRHYRAGSIVIAAAGALSHDRVVKLARDKFEFPEGLSEGMLPAARMDTQKLLLIPNDNNQVHAVIGYPGLAWTDKRRTAAMVLSTLLGGGMSSILFQQIREERGLAYTIYTYHDSYCDAGVFGCYFATDKQRLPEALSVVQKQLLKLCNRKVSEDILRRIKEQIKGQVMLALESTIAKMNRMARFELMQGEYISLTRTIRDIDRVTTDDLQMIARALFNPEGRTVTILGPANRKTVEAVLEE
ncbi:MAG TPA: pitrilysin family protein [candidate division Zixibacteria bacterium]|nr:pitrilysin family protein [candidate division Zixibacteria bacterium]